MNISVGFIGAGNLTSAIIAGLTLKQYPSSKIWASNPSVEKLNKLKNDNGINTTTNNLTLTQNSDIIFLAVKPHLISQVVNEIKPHITQQIVVSLAAGVELANLKNLLPNSQIARAMPNTPARFAKGVCAMYGPSLSNAAKNHLNTIFSLVGEAFWLEDENLFDAITPVTGSLPAYVFKLILSFVAAATNLNIDKEIASKMIIQTFLGAALMAKENQRSLTDLIDEVTSKGGVTKAALDSFRENHLDETINNAIQAGYKRTKELNYKD